MDNPAAVICEFDYRPPKLLSVALFVLAIAGAVLLAYFAVYLDKPMNWGRLKLTPEWGRMFFAVFALLSPIGVAALGANLYAAFAFKRRVAVTKRHILLPKPTFLGLSCDEVKIPFDGIESVAMQPFMGSTVILRLVPWHGKAICIPSNMFQSAEVFRELHHVVQQRVQDAHRGSR